MDLLPYELHLEILSKLRSARDAYNYVMANCLKISVDKLIYEGIIKPEGKSGLYVYGNSSSYCHWVDGIIDSYDDRQYYQRGNYFGSVRMRIDGLSCAVHHTNFGLLKTMHGFTNILYLLNDKEVVTGSLTDCFVNLPMQRGRLLYGMRHGIWEIFDVKDGRKKRTIHYDFDKRHCVDGPAVINHLKKSDKKEWFIHNLRHREDGPAIEGAKMKKYYYWGVEFKSMEEMKSSVKIETEYGVSNIFINNEPISPDLDYVTSSLPGKGTKCIKNILLKYLGNNEKIDLAIDDRYAIVEWKSYN